MRSQELGFNLESMESVPYEQAQEDNGGEIHMEVPEYTIVTLAEDGLGFGDGAISRQERYALEGNEDLPERVEQALQSDKLLVPVSIDAATGEPIKDDGCGDGRNVKTVLQQFDGELRQRKHSLARPKVFGGGATMEVAVLVGDGLGEKPLQAVFNDARNELARAGVDFGGHTDNHAHGDLCGCGAIDKAPQVLEKTVQHRDNIKAVALAVAGNVPDWQGRLADVQTIETELDTILANFAAAAAANRPATDGGPAYSGMEVMKGIISDGKIVKELADDHQEVELVLNTVADTTVDQEFVRSASQAGPELPARAQVFAVDEWRLRQLAEGDL